jgi:hypothetical protein
LKQKLTSTVLISRLYGRYRHAVHAWPACTGPCYLQIRVLTLATQSVRRNDTAAYARTHGRQRCRWFLLFALLGSSTRYGHAIQRHVPIPTVAKPSDISFKT